MHYSTLSMADIFFLLGFSGFWEVKTISQPPLNFFGSQLPDFACPNGDMVKTKFKMMSLLDNKYRNKASEITLEPKKTKKKCLELFLDLSVGPRNIFLDLYRHYYQWGARDKKRKMESVNSEVISHELSLRSFKRKTDQKTSHLFERNPSKSFFSVLWVIID